MSDTRLKLLVVGGLLALIAFLCVLSALTGSNQDLTVEHLVFLLSVVVGVLFPREVAQALEKRKK